MNKKYLSVILFGALMLGTTGTFTSCKDYDDDINNLQEQVDGIKADLETLKAQVDAGKYITSVTSTDNGLTITLNDGTSYNVTNGEKGEAGDKLSIDENGQWLINGEATGWYSTKEAGETEKVVVPEVGEDGYWYFADPETGELVKSDYKAVPVSAVEANGICTLTVYNADGTTTVVELPTVAATITELEFVGYTKADGTFVPFNGNNDNTYAVPYSAFYFDNDSKLTFTAAENQKIEETIAKKTAISGLAGASLVVRVAPVTADMSAYELALVNSKLAEAPIELGAPVAYTGLVTKASSANGLWSIPMNSKKVTNVESLNKFKENFKVAAGDVAFALQASNVNFLSNYNLVFDYQNAKVTNVKLNGTAITSFTSATSNVTYKDADNAYLVKLNDKNTFSLTVPTSVYKSQVMVDDLYADRWGVKIDGNSFTVTKFYDKQTVPAFPVYFWFYDLVGQKNVKITVWVRLENSISDLTTLDAVAHEIKADPTKDNFSASLSAMFNDFGTSGTLEWKDRVKRGDIKIMQVGTGANGADKDVTSTLLTNNDIKITYLKSDGTTTTTLADIATLKVDLSHGWPGSGNDYALDKEYYVEIKFYDATTGGDVLNTVRLPFTLSIPDLNTLFVQQSGVFVNGVANAYMDADATQDANSSGVVTPRYVIKGAFQEFAKNVGSSTFDVALDNNTKISGNNKSANLASFVDNTDTNNAITNVTSTNIEKLAIKLTTTGVTINGDGTPEGYGKELLASFKNIKYVGKYSYGDATYDFKIKVMSPILEGYVTAVNGSVEIPATDLNGTKINDSHIKGYTYNDIVYSIFYKAGTSDWARKEIKDVDFAVPSSSANLFTVGDLEEGSAATSTAAEVPSYVLVTPKNLAETTTGDLSVTVTDAWGYTLTQTIKVTVKVGE